MQFLHHVLKIGTQIALHGLANKIERLILKTVIHQLVFCRDEDHVWLTGHRTHRFSDIKAGHLRDIDIQKQHVKRRVSMFFEQLLPIGKCPHVRLGALHFKEGGHGRYDIVKIHPIVVTHGYTDHAAPLLYK